VSNESTERMPVLLVFVVIMSVVTCVCAGVSVLVGTALPLVAAFVLAVPSSVVLITVLRHRKDTGH
jgi:hypothetical protein